MPWKRAWPSSVFLPGETPWTEEPSGLQSIGSQTASQIHTSIRWLLFLKWTSFYLLRKTIVWFSLAFKISVTIWEANKENWTGVSIKDLHLSLGSEGLWKNLYNSSEAVASWCSISPPHTYIHTHTHIHARTRCLGNQRLLKKKRKRSHFPRRRNPLPVHEAQASFFCPISCALCCHGPWTWVQACA